MSKNTVPRLSAGQPADGGRTVFLLGGQGSQYFGMARRLWDGDDVFRATMTRLDELGTRRSGRSVLEYVYDPARGFGDRCDDLHMTNLALFMVEYSLADTLAVRGVRPDLLVGSSLGEFIAAGIAGYVSVERIVEFLCELSDCVEQSMPPGGMVAVLTDLDRFNRAVVPRSDISLASINSESHFVISGDVAALDRARRAFVDKDILFQDLPVNFAFHSYAVEAMARRMPDFGEQIRVTAPVDGPLVWSSRTAAPVTEVSTSTCWDVIRGPIRFTETVTNIPDYLSHSYVDLSPSASLASMLRLRVKDARSFPVITPFNAEFANIERIVESCGARV